MKPITGIAGNFAYPAVFLSKALEIKKTILYFTQKCTIKSYHIFTTIAKLISVLMSRSVVTPLFTDNRKSVSSPGSLILSLCKALRC